jgi:hypothetical protein
MNDHLPPRFGNYVQCRDWCDETGRCPACGGESARKQGGGMLCIKCRGGWNNNGNLDEYLAYVHGIQDELRGPPLLNCANCDDPCPTDDYLCQPCRKLT